MNKKAFSIVLMVIIFGLPVGWYLFLQFFGENKFDLPVIEQWNNDCAPDLKSKVVVDGQSAEEYPNEMDVVNQKLIGQTILKLTTMDFDSCKLSNDIYLIDQLGQVRGSYEMNRVDVDRFAAEIDIYILNSQDGASIKRQ